MFLFRTAPKERSTPPHRTDRTGERTRTFARTPLRALTTGLLTAALALAFSTAAFAGAINAQAGMATPWQASTGSTGGSFQAASGNKITSLPLTGWTARGGLSVNLALFHNSQGAYSAAGYGARWSHSFHITLY